MKAIYKMKVNIYTSASVANTNDYKDSIIDTLVQIRDNFRDIYNQEPILTMSASTFIYLEHLFLLEGIIKTHPDKSITFWSLPVLITNQRTGHIHFNIKEK